MRKIIKIFIALLAILMIYLAVDLFATREKMSFGVTFSKPFAEFMGLDWREAYSAILDDLGVKKIRLMSYWTEIEPREGKYSFEDLDWQIAQAADRGANIILVVGQKQPRWPECHIPDWAKKMTAAERESSVLELIEEVVDRYADRENIIAWQVENEPFFSFGECPEFSSVFFDREIALVRSHDPSRPIIVSDSGELSVWYRAASRSDILGTTMYWTVWNKTIGYFHYPIPASFYTVKSEIMKLITNTQKTIIVELQSEAWGPKMPNEMSSEEQNKSMNPDKFRAIVSYAKSTGFSESYFWGAEYWYWLKKVKGDDRMWNAAKIIFRE